MSRGERLHGASLVAFAAMVPVGEGLAYAALALCGLAAALRRGAVDWSAVARGNTRPVSLGLLAWLGFGLIALLFAGQGWLKPGELGRWLPLLAIPIIAASVTALDRRWLDRAVLAFALALGLACLFGLAQHLLNVRPGEWLARAEVSMAGQGRVPGRWDRSVAGGFYFHRLKMGHVLLVGLGLVAGRLLFAGLERRRWLIEAGLAALYSVTLLLTYTRGAVLAAGAGLVACLPLAPRRFRWAALALGIAATAGAFGVPSIRERILSIGGSEASSDRALIWSQGARIIADHPLGVGLGNYSVVVGRYYDTIDPGFSVRTYPHNLVLAALAETGPLGLLGYVAAWVALALACVATLRRRQGAARTAAGAGLFVVVAVWVVGLTHDVLYHNAVALAFAGAVGVVLGYLDGREPSEN